MIRLVVKKNWVFERDGVGRGPILKKDDKIQCTVDFAKKLIRREVAVLAEENDKGTFVAFPPPSQSAQSSEVQKELSKLDAMIGDKDDAKSNAAPKFGNDRSANIVSGSGKASSSS